MNHPGTHTPAKGARRAALLVLGCAALSSAAQSATVSAGWHLFRSASPTQIDFSGTPYAFLGTVEFASSPISVFDFGGTIGVQPLGDPDTIIRRNDDAEEGRDRRGGGDVPWNDPGEGVIDIELVALSLRSTTPIDLGPIGGPTNVNFDVRFMADQGSTMTINFTAATIDIELVALALIQTNTFTGPNFNLNLQLFDHPWLREVDPDTPNPTLIPGVNTQLNGTDSGTDIFLQGKAKLEDPNNPNTVQSVHDGGIPEPSSGILLSLAALVLLRFRRPR